MLKMRNIVLFLSLLLLQAGLVKSEIVPLDIVLDASSEEVHYIRGYLQAPATIDLSQVLLVTTLEPDFAHGDDMPDGEFYTDDGALTDDGMGTTDDEGAFPKNDDQGGSNEMTNPTLAPSKSGGGGGGSTHSPGGNSPGGNSPTDAPSNEGQDSSGSDIGNSDSGSDNGSGSSPSDGGELSPPDGGDNSLAGEGPTESPVESPGSHSDGGNDGNEDSPVESPGGDDGSDGLDANESSPTKAPSPSGNDETQSPTIKKNTEHQGGGGGNGEHGGDHGGANGEHGGDHGGANGDHGGDHGGEHGGTNGSHGGEHGGANGDHGGHEGNTHTQAPTAVPPNRKLQSQRVTQIIDFVLFMIPADCKKDIWGHCDWSALGIGAADDYVEGDISYCCSQETVDRGVCESKDIGKLILDPVLFSGEQRSVVVPSADNEEFRLDEPVFDIEVSGDYVMLMGNCYDDGIEVLELGTMEWKSVGGYLPGDLVGLMFFYAALSAFYFVLYIWYSCGMRIFQDSAIPIQKYIVSTIFLGLLELTCKAIDLGYWNLDGYRSTPLVYAALGLGVLKDGLSRVLGVMVAKGWGIVRESLGTAMIKILLLGLIYTGLAGFRDFSLIIAAEDVKKLSISAEEELVDFALILTPLIIVINLFFYFWILNSLNATADYLRNMSQTSKLNRHLKLRCVMVTSMTIAAAWLAFTVVDISAGGILTQDQQWAMEAAMHANYLFILTGVSLLWRPNSNAKDYAMQMQIPTMGEDDNDLELSCVVPSASSMEDGNDPDHRNGIRVNQGRFS